MGAAGRYVDDDNYLWLALRWTGPSLPYLEFVKKVAGVPTTIASTLLSQTMVASAAHRLSLVVFSSGRAIGSISGANQGTVEVVDAVLATGGALASGKGGIADQNLAVTSLGRRYDDVAVLTPAAEPIALYSGRELKISSDATERESSAGGTWGRPALYRGTRFKVQPAGVEDRTTRVAVKASRNDLDSAADDNLTDQIKLEATVTPRYSVVPR